MKAKFTTDALANNLRNSQLGEAGLRRYAPSSSKVSYSPTLTGSVSDPSGYAPGIFSPGNTLTAAWVRQDDMVNLWFSLLVGGSFNAGSGVWSLSLPVEANTTYGHIGTWRGTDSNTGNSCNGAAHLGSSTTAVFYYPATAPIGANTSVGHILPWTWATGDTWTGHLSYLAA